MRISQEALLPSRVPVEMIAVAKGPDHWMIGAMVAGFAVWPFAALAGNWACGFSGTG